MAFISKNELDHFGFEDCICREFQREGDTIRLTLEALIVKAEHSQNGNYADCHADITACTMENVEIIAVLKEGYTRYDANDNVVEEVMDEPIAPCDYADIYKKVANSYLIRFFRTKEDYLLEFEVPAEEGGMPDAYEFRIDATKVTFQWEKLINR